MSPTFQKAWYKRNKMELPPHLTGSVKQASKEVKPSERVKKLQTKSLQAYGATKGLKVGGEHGSGEMKDTIAPLTRDQHSKVQAAARAAKAAEKSAAKKTPLTKSQRMSAIAAAVRKAQTKHDVPTMEPDDESHDDLRDLHQSLHIRKGYNEEVEQIGESDDYLDMRHTSYSVGKQTDPNDPLAGRGSFSGDPSKQRYLSTERGKKNAAKRNISTLKSFIKSSLGKHGKPNLPEEVELDEASPMIKPPTNRFDKKSDAFAHAEKHGGKVYKQTYTDSKGQQTVSYSVKKEEVEMNEASKAEAEKLLGGPVKTRTGNEPKGKLPLGFRRARNLARQAMKGGVSAIHRSMEKTMQKENVTESTTEVNEMSSHGKALAKAIMAKQSKRPIAQMMGEAGDEPRHTADAGEYDYEGDMAKSQLKSIITNAQRLHDMLEDTTNLPEWVQSKITLTEDYVLTAANYMEGEMNEEALAELAASLDEEIELFEKAPPGSKYERMVKHIKKGYAKGGLTPKEKSIAYATAWKSYKKNEEVEHIDELKKSTLASYVNKAANQVRAKSGIAASFETSGARKRDPENKEAYMSLAADYRKGAKKRLTGIEKATAKLAKEEVEQVTEAEGTVAVTPKEKELAAHHGDPKKITYGDVIKARLKSAAAKKMGK